MYANDAQLKSAKIREIEGRYNSQINDLLTPSQKAHFEAYLNNLAHASVIETK